MSETSHNFSDTPFIPKESGCTNTSCCPTPQPTLTRATQKIGRNDPCVCGNGRKYKKCCGQNA